MAGSRSFKVLRRCAVAAGFGLAAFVSACASAAQAQPAHITREVSEFLQLEQQLADAMRERREQALDATLADDFEMTVAREPERAVPREDWLQAVLKSGGPLRSVDGLAVHRWGETAVVSFVLRTRHASGAGLFVVDTWRQAGTQWRLALRHVAAAQSPPGAAIPGWAPSSEVVKKY